VPGQRYDAKSQSRYSKHMTAGVRTRRYCSHLFQSRSRGFVTMRQGRFVGVHLSNRGILKGAPNLI
jgi:hypothetical protein